MAKGTFKKVLPAFEAKARARIDQVRRASILELFTLVIKTTPVDKGFLRGAWQTQVNSPNVSAILRADKTGDQAIAEVLGNMGKLADAVFFTNTMPYAERIEYDSWSAQALNGMLRVNIVRWPQIVAAKAKAFSD